METAFQKVKVHNEIEWCEVNDLAIKEMIERALLKNRVSYWISWSKPGFFSSDKKDRCVFCVNQLQKDTADEALKEFPEEVLGKITFLNRRVDKVYY